MKDGSLDHTTQDWGKYFSFHGYTFKHDIPYSINNWIRQFYIKIKIISISMFVSIPFYVWWFWCLGWRRRYCDSSLSGTCHSAALGETVCPTFSTRVNSGHPAHCLLHNRLSVHDSGWVPFLPPTLLWKQPNLKRTLAYPYVNTHTLSWINF